MSHSNVFLFLYPEPIHEILVVRCHETPSMDTLLHGLSLYLVYDLLPIKVLVKSSTRTRNKEADL